MKINKYIKRHIKFLEINGKRTALIKRDSCYFWNIIRCINICVEYSNRYIIKNKH